jgi:hypothetical protein
MSLDTLLTQPANRETGEALVRWVEDLRGRVLAGEMMIGILSEWEVARAPQALERAIACGADEAWAALRSDIILSARQTTQPRTMRSTKIKLVLYVACSNCTAFVASALAPSLG